jgi:hypothetical protein
VFSIVTVRIQRLAQEIKRDDRGEDGERDRDHDDQGRAPRTQKHQYHQRRQSRRDGALAQDAHHGGDNENRLVEQLADLQTGQRRGARNVQRILDAVDHVKR